MSADNTELRSQRLTTLIVRLTTIHKPCTYLIAKQVKYFLQLFFFGIFSNNESIISPLQPFFRSSFTLFFALCVFHEYSWFGHAWMRSLDVTVIGHFKACNGLPLSVSCFCYNSVSFCAHDQYQRIPLSVESPDRVNLELVQISPSADHEESNDEFLPDSWDSPLIAENGIKIYLIVEKWPEI